MPQAQHPQHKKSSVFFKSLVLLLVLATIGALVYFNLKKEKAPETFATTAVKRGKLIDKLAETGTIELVRTVQVQPTVSGEILGLPVEAGNWVAKNQLMAVIEPDPTQSLQLYQKRSAVDQTQINLREQERNFERKKTLFDSNMLASKEFEDAEIQLIRTRSNLRLARLELEILETKANLNPIEERDGTLVLDEVRVLAPISGIVIRRDVEIGEVVLSGLSSLSDGTVLFEIGDPSQMIVRADIAEIDIGQLHVGQVVDIVVDAYSDTTYQGRVRWIAPVAQKKPGNTIVTFDVEIDILDREPRLKQGMSCDLDIIFSRQDSALYLPVEAVLEVFDKTDADEEKAKGRRGRFIAYIVRPAYEDSATADLLSSAATKQEGQEHIADVTIATIADSLLPVKGQEPAESILDKFVEVELHIGLETSTRVEILAGLEESDRVAEDPQLIRQKLEQKAKVSKPKFSSNYNPRK